MLPTIRTILHRRLCRGIPSLHNASTIPRVSELIGEIRVSSTRNFSSGKDDPWDNAWAGTDQSRSGGGGGGSGGGGEAISRLDWGEVSSWSTGLTKDHFDGEAVGRQIPAAGGRIEEDPKAVAEAMDGEDEMVRMLEKDNRENKAFGDGWGERMMETYKLLKQVREPGVRGSYLKDSEKAEMYRLHKENPEVYTVEQLAKDYRIMRQRVHAILWLKKMEEEEEKKIGKPLDDSVEILLDNFPE